MSNAAIGDQNGGDGVAETRFSEVLRCLGSECRSRVGQKQHDGGKGQSDKSAKNHSPKALRFAGVFGGLGLPGLPQAGGGANEQHARDAAANRGLRQRHINREKANPNDRKKQAIGNIANGGSKNLARENGPDGERQYQGRQANVESLQNTHAAGPLRRTARPISCATVAPAN